MLNIEKCLIFAEMARLDPSLLENHMGTVDRKLTEKRAENKKLLDSIRGDSEQAEMIGELESENAAIDSALTVYAHGAERCKPVISLCCTRCGEHYHGRQWHNQDTGYGLGDCCVEFVKKSYSDDGTQTFEQCYGIDGIHYNVAKHA